MKFIVDQIDTKKRLDVYLSEKLGVTRSAVLHTIKRNEANVNGKPASAGLRLKTGDVVTTLP